MLNWLKRRAWPVLGRTWEGWQKHDGMLLSAAMAYYAAFSLFPLCLVLISILGFGMRLWPKAENEVRQLLDLVGQYAGPWLAAQLGELLAGVQSKAGLGGPIGVVALLIAAIGVFMQLDYSFDLIWRNEPVESKGWLAAVRSALWDRLVAFLMLLSVGAMLLAVFLANLVLAGIRPYVVHLQGGHLVWHWGQIGFTLVTNALLFGIIYKVLPKASVRWRHALAAGLLVSFVWFLGQQLLTSFVIGESYTAYGVVGSFIAVMLWLYYASAVIFFGAEFVQALSHPQPRKEKRPR